MLLLLLLLIFSSVEVKRLTQNHTTISFKVEIWLWVCKDSEAHVATKDKRLSRQSAHFPQRVRGGVAEEMKFDLGGICTRRKDTRTGEGKKSGGVEAKVWVRSSERTALQQEWVLLRDVCTCPSSSMEGTLESCFWSTTLSPVPWCEHIFLSSRTLLWLLWAGTNVCPVFTTSACTLCPHIGSTFELAFEWTSVTAKSPAKRDLTLIAPSGCT